MIKNILLFGLASLAAAESLYSSLNSNVQTYSQKNFDSQVINNRAKGITVVHFYKEDGKIYFHYSLRYSICLLIDGVSKSSSGQYEKMAKDTKQMLRVGGIDCSVHANICKKQNVEKFPTWRVYPPFPAPTVDYDGAGDLDVDKLKKMTYRFIGNRAIELTSANHQTFVDDQPGKSKVILFTKAKKGVPVIFKAMSSHFDVSSINSAQTI